MWRFLRGPGFTSGELQQSTICCYLGLRFLQSHANICPKPPVSMANSTRQLDADGNWRKVDREKEECCVVMLADEKRKVTVWRGEEGWCCPGCQGVFENQLTLFVSPGIFRLLRG